MGKQTGPPGEDIPTPTPASRTAVAASFCSTALDDLSSRVRVSIAGQSVLLLGAAATVEVVERPNQHRHVAIGSHCRQRTLFHDQTEPGFTRHRP